MLQLSITGTSSERWTRDQETRRDVAEADSLLAVLAILRTNIWQVVYTLMSSGCNDVTTHSLVETVKLIFHLCISGRKSDESKDAWREFTFHCACSNFAERGTLSAVAPDCVPGTHP